MDKWPPLPMTVLGGYLGAGKTTMLNYLLRENAGRRIAVLVNDFGSVNIDARLIAAHDGDTISLTNGCICCSLVNGFRDALASLRERDPAPELVLIESSGVADPQKIGQWGHTPGYRLDGVIVLVDVETIRVRARDKYVGKTILRQLRGADLLVLTKTDLATAEEVAAVSAWLRNVVPGARLATAINGVLPLAILLGAGATNPGQAAPDAAGVETLHAVDYATATLHRDTPISADIFRAAIAELPEAILRAKGIVWLIDDPERQTVFQLVGKRWSLKPGEPWGEQPPGTDLVFIGLPGSIDSDRLERALCAQPVTGEPLALQR